MPRCHAYLLLIALLLPTVFTSAVAEDLTADQAAELARIRSEIARQNLPWRAGDNPIFRLPADERNRRNGSPAPSSWQGPLPSQRRDLPLLLDWRDNDGNWVTPVRNQGGCGSCWIFSAVAATETWFMQQTGAPIPSFDLSEQFVLSCVDQGSCDGGWCYNALTFLATEGTCDEDCFPYVADDRVPCNAACSDVLERLVFLGDQRQITSGVIDVDAINTALQEGPVVTNFTVYTDFYGYSDGVYVWDGESPADGGHSVIVIGYDENRDAWLAKNSWGTNFGELGYFWIAYDSGTGFGSDTWQACEANQRPQLRDAGCEPELAVPGTIVTWSVTYSDAEADVPLVATLTLHDPGGRTEDHQLAAGEGDLISGVPYTVSLVLEEVGQYGTQFQFFNEAGQEVTWPSSGFADLPQVEPVLAVPAIGLVSLHPPAPNPANPGCTVGYELTAAGRMDLAVFDLAGRRVATLASGWREAGVHRATWHGQDVSGRAVPSGTYLMRLRTGDLVTARKISLVQ